jgi:tRNA threonylcarbamoyl adenosine modification protein YeaZ
MSDRLVLALDGATRVCSAALLHPRVLAGTYEGPESLWEVVARRSHPDARGQGRILLRAVDDMLREIGGRPADIGAIVVGTGPGTFTGVRIAVATARALSLALSVPVAGVSTLSSLAAFVTRDTAAHLLVPVVDARRGQVFFGLYKAAGDPKARRWVRGAAFGVCDRKELGCTLGGSTVVVAEDETLVGELPEGVEFVAAPVEAEYLVIGQRFLAEPRDFAQGSRLTPWLLEALVTGAPVEPESVKPIYVRSPDADVHITKMKDPWAGGSGTQAHGAGR